jgi:hypothetical protein
MGWDAGLNRKLAVPLALDNLWENAAAKRTVRRILRESEEDPGDIEIMRRLAENKVRLTRLWDDIESNPVSAETRDVQNDLDYLKASIQLGLLQVAADLGDIPYSDEIFEEAVA